MKGTRDLNTGDSNRLYLPTRTLVFMLRNDDWLSVNRTTWINTRDKGNYLGSAAGTIRIHKRTFAAGYHTLDNKGAMYLFVDEGIPIWVIQLN